MKSSLKHLPVALAQLSASIPAHTRSMADISLFNSTINTSLGKREDRRLSTGTHTVADLQCAGCEKYLGWKYIKAPNGEQRYKEGKSLDTRV